MNKNVPSAPAHALSSLLAIAVTTGACSGDEPAGGTASSAGQAADAAQGRANARSQVFPDSLAKGFEQEVSAPIPGGGIAAVGRICRGSGADVFYVGVNGATGLPDGQHAVSVDNIDETLVFATGAPDSGVGAGAAQAAFDEAEYTFTFEDIDVVITIAGCRQ